MIWLGGLACMAHFHPCPGVLSLGLCSCPPGKDYYKCQCPRVMHATGGGEGGAPAQPPMGVQQLVDTLLERVRLPTGDSSSSSSGSSSSSLHGTHCLPGEARTHHTSLHQQSK